jgi:hypothetical protein
MTSMGWRNAVTWCLLGLMFLLFALVFGAAPALAWDLGQLWLDTNAVAADTILYEVTEDMFLKDAAGNFVTSPVPGGRRIAVAQLSGWSKLGTPLCPAWVLMISPTAKKCAVNAQGSDDLSLATGQGTLKGTFSVVVQGDNLVDASEFVIMTGTFAGDADLSPAFAGRAPLGYITNGVATVDGSDVKLPFTGKFRLPIKLKTTSTLSDLLQLDAYYLSDAGLPLWVKANERSLGVPAVRLEIKF